MPEDTTNNPTITDPEVVGGTVPETPAPDVITSPTQVQQPPASPTTLPMTAVPANAGLPSTATAVVPTTAAPVAPKQTTQQKIKSGIHGVLSAMLEGLSPSMREADSPKDANGNPVEERLEQVPTGQRVLGGVGRILGGMGAGMAAAGHGGGGFGRSFGASFNKEEEMQNEAQARQKQLIQNNLTMYQVYRNHVANEAATQEKNTAVSAPTVEGIREAITQGKSAFPVNEAKGVVSTDAIKAAADFHAQHPEMEVVGFPTGQNKEGKNIFSLFYGRNLHDLTMTANEEMAKQQGIAVGADISLAAAGKHVVNQIAETNLSHQADRELMDNPWETKLKFGEQEREKLLNELEPATRERVQESFLKWSKKHTQVFRDPQLDLNALEKEDPKAAGDVDTYLYGEGNITKLHNAITDAAVRAKTEGQKDLENGPLTLPNAQSIIAMAGTDPTRFKPERVQAAKDFLSVQHATTIDKSLEAMETKPSELAGENSLAASAQLTGLLQDDTVMKDPKLAIRVNRLLTVANTAHKLWSADKQAQESAAAFAAEAAKNGSPEAAGKLLSDYTMTLGDLKNRTINSAFIEKAVNWAIAHPSDPKHPYSVAAAAGWESAAKSPRFVNFFGNSDSLIRPSGTLDQLLDAGNKVDKINEHDWKILREAKNWTELQQGHPELSGFAATALGVADDYAKVLGGGGTASDTSRAQILHIIDPSLSHAQRAEAIENMRKSIYSQRSSYIGNNPFLKQMYGDIPVESPQGSSKSAASPASPAGHIVPKGKVPLFDKAGNVAGYADDQNKTNAVRF